MAIIEINDCSYRYPLSNEFALKNINLSVNKGDFIGIIGANGSGKTTLANAIRGFVPQFYKGDFFGTIQIDGTDLQSKTLGEWATKIGYIFQNPFNQISYIKETVFGEIAFGLENLGIAPAEILQRTQDIIEQLGIGYLADKNPFEISGGQQQRVALASILVMNPDILVIDEPTSQLDPQGTEEVFEVIDLIKKEGKTVLLIEHKIDLLSKYANQIVVMSKGRIVMQGAAKEILADASLEKQEAPMPTYAKIGHLLMKASLINHMPNSEEETASAIRDILSNRSGNERN